MGWPAFILPFMEEQAIYELIDFTALAYTSHAGGEGCYHDNAANGDSVNKAAADSMPESFQCPSAVERWEDHKDYSAAANSTFNCCPERKAQNGMFFRNSDTKMRDILDGTATTFMILEDAHVWYKTNGTLYTVGANPFFWVNHASAGYASGGYAPNAVQNGNYSRFARSFHPGGLQATMADASVTFVSDAINLGVYRNTFTIRGSEVETVNSN